VRKLLNLKRDKNQLQFDELEIASKHSVEQIDFDAYEIEYIMQAIAALPSGFCTVFNLFEIDGYSHKEIGEMLGISPASSRSQLSRAKQKLAQQLQLSTYKRAS